jgi:hypothetical protein
MKETINTNMPISWRVTLSDGTTYYDQDRETESGQPSWFELKDLISSNESLRINSMQLILQAEDGLHSVGSGRDGCDGYFFSRRVSTTLGEGASQENFAIGHLVDGKVYLSWYNYQLHALESEIRDESGCGFGLIKND